MLRAYIDTCVISGLAKNELSKVDTDALLRILEAQKADQLELFVSELVLREIQAIPAEFRVRHSVIYSLLANISLAPTQTRTPPFKPTDFPFGLRKDRVLEALEELLPDRTDAEHVFHAVRSGVPYVVTVDRRTMISRSDAVRERCGVHLVDPPAFSELI